MGLAVLGLAALVPLVSPAHAASAPGPLTRSSGDSVQQARPGAGATRIVTVLDPQGAAVAGAVVTVTDTPQAGGTATQIGQPVLSRAVTRDDGRADVDAPGADGALTLVVEAPGFETAREPWPATGSSPLVVRLRPAGLVEQISVTAGRRQARGAEVPADATILLARDVEGVASATLDDVLRLTPGFSLFRRNSSRSANPTTQGVTLRGLSASGASRTLVLADGVPLNDPFGGWVSWTRVPVAAIERVEVVRGGSSDLYGADAAGGVIQIVTAQPASSSLRVLAEAGTQETGRLSALGAVAMRGWRAGSSIEAATTEGGIPIAPEVRGPVDTAAGNDSRVATLFLVPPAVGGWRGTLRGGVHSEDRTNGTPLQVNDTNQRQVSADAGGRAGAGDLRVRYYAAGQGYDQSFSAVNATRTSENLTLRQRVASTTSGGSGEYLGVAGQVTWLGGADIRRVAGDLEERPTATGALNLSSGSQTQSGAFGQLTWVPSTRWIVVGGVRADRIATDTTVAASTTSRAVSPKISLVWAPRADTTLRGSAYTAFRAPTLNERLRSFRVGNVVTRNNPALDTEDLRGGELSAQIERATVSGRVTGFFTTLDNAITNVTISRTPSLITRERRNAGTVEARGLEVEGRWRPYAPVRVGASFTLTRSRFSDAVEPELAGRRVPQVPSAQGAVDVRWQLNAATAFSAQTRWTGRQFDDDLNVFALAEAWVVDVLGERRLTAQSRVFVAIENLFDEDYDAGRTPQRTVGLPRRVRVGVRVNLSP